MRKSRYTSSAKRNSYFFFKKWNIFNLDRQLTLRPISKSGRNDSGRIIIRTKGALLKKFKKTKINYNYRYLKMGSIMAFKFIPFQNKLVSLLYFANGALTYYSTTETHKLFSFFFFNKHKRLKKIKLKSLSLMLCQIKKLSFVSCLELIPGAGAKYSRSTGTKAKVIKFDGETHSVLVQLPSKIKKIFSYYSFVLTGPLALPENKRYMNTKAGYWRAFGCKPTVRGVAMNPVDHPHGGRTCTVKYPRTPWGKTTKFK